MWIIILPLHSKTNTMKNQERINKALDTALLVVCLFMAVVAGAILIYSLTLNPFA